MENKIIVTLGIDTATAYTDERTINLPAYATAVAKLVRPQFPELAFSFSAREGDNAETAIEFPNTISDPDAITEAVQNAEGEVFPDESVWNA